MKLPTLIAAATLCLAAPAFADDIVIVHLKSGDEFRGTLVERVVGDHLTIQLATGEFRRFAWADIESQTPASAPAAPSATPTPYGTLVHIEVMGGKAPATLRMSNGAIYVSGSHVGYDVWQEDKCSAPCDQRVQPGMDYTIGGPSITESGAFKLTGDSARLLVHPGDRATHTWGVFSTITGTLVTATGAALIPFLTAYPDAINISDKWKPVPFVIMGVGAILLVVGIPCWLNNQTSVEPQRVINAMNGRFVF